MRAANQVPSDIGDYVAYDPATGALTWKVHRYAHKVGQPAGSRTKQGYWRIGFRGKFYVGTHVIWFLMTGSNPPGLIDHADCDQANDRWANLRVASDSESMANRRGWGAHRKGVYPKPNGKFAAEIFHQGVRHYLGSFATEAEAGAAYAGAARVLFGKFARADSFPVLPERQAA